MYRFTPVIPGLLLMAAALMTPPAWGDSGGNGGERPWLFSLSSNYGSWSTGDLDNEGNQALGFYQLAYTSENWGVALTGIYAKTSYRTTVSADRFEVSTPTDTDISSFYQYKRANLTLRGGLDARAPTGKASYSDTELNSIFTDDLSQDLMSVNSYGGGINLSPHFMAAYKAGAIVVGAGMKYEITGEYDPTTDTADDNFDPGDRLLALINTAWTMPGDRFLMLTLSYGAVGRDKQGGGDVYKEGDTYSAEIRFIQHWLDSIDTVLSLNVQTQAKNRLLGEDNVIKSEISNSNNNVYEIFINNVYQYTPKFSINALAGYKQALANGYAEDDPLYDAGREKFYVEPAMAWYPTSRLYFTFRIRYTLAKDKKDAVSPQDASYNILNADAGMAYNF